MKYLIIFAVLSSFCLCDDADARRRRYKPKWKFRTNVTRRAVAPTSPLVEVPDYEYRAYQFRVLELVNNERGRRDLHPLDIHGGLCQRSQEHSWWMARHRAMVHSPVWENIAAGQPTCESVMRDWMRSPGHRAAILSPNATRIGIACGKAKNGMLYWTQQFLK